MNNGLVDTAAQLEAPDDRRIYGVTIGHVVKNCDETRQGRVQVRFTWLPGYEPWARVAVLMAGANGGTYFMPQVGQEVLVAFNHGDIREPYIVGSVWNGLDFSPAQLPKDAENKRIIRTPARHEIIFDDLTGSVTIKTGDGQSVTIGPAGVDIVTKNGAATISLKDSGQLSLRADSSIQLDAPYISLNGQSVLIAAEATTTISGGPLCQIKADMVRINDP